MPPSSLSQSQHRHHSSLSSDDDPFAVVAVAPTRPSLQARPGLSRPGMARTASFRLVSSSKDTASFRNNNLSGSSHVPNSNFNSLSHSMHRGGGGGGGAAAARQLRRASMEAVMFADDHDDDDDDDDDDGFHHSDDDDDDKNLKGAASNPHNSTTNRRPSLLSQPPQSQRPGLSIRTGSSRNLRLEAGSHHQSTSMAKTRFTPSRSKSQRFLMATNTKTDEAPAAAAEEDSKETSAQRLQRGRLAGPSLKSGNSQNPRARSRSRGRISRSRSDQLARSKSRSRLNDEEGAGNLQTQQEAILDSNHGGKHENDIHDDEVEVEDVKESFLSFLASDRQKQQTGSDHRPRSGSGGDSSAVQAPQRHGQHIGRRSSMGALPPSSEGVTAKNSHDPQEQRPNHRRDRRSSMGSSRAMSCRHISSSITSSRSNTNGGSGGGSRRSIHQGDEGPPSRQSSSRSIDHQEKHTPSRSSSSRNLGHNQHRHDGNDQDEPKRNKEQEGGKDRHRSSAGHHKTSRRSSMGNMDRSMSVRDFGHSKNARRSSMGGAGMELMASSMGRNRSNSVRNMNASPEEPPTSSSPTPVSSTDLGKQEVLASSPSTEYTRSSSGRDITVSQDVPEKSSNMDFILATTLSQRNLATAKETATGENLYKDILEIDCRVRLHCGEDLAPKDRNMLGQLTSSDPYVEVWKNLPTEKVATSDVSYKTLNPDFEEIFHVKWDEKGLSRSLSNRHHTKMTLKVFDDGKFASPEAMGTVEILIPLAGAGEDSFDMPNQWFDIDPSSAKNAKGRLKVSITVTYKRKAPSPEELIR